MNILMLNLLGLLLFIASIQAKVYNNKVLLVSMDGFRPDYLDGVETPNFDRFIKEGVRAQYMKPCYPSNTFPNHYTTVTGLYPESHGITDNGMFDPILNATFTKATEEPEWWEGGEPIWVTAKKQGLKVGTYFWPGSGVKIHGIRPDIWFPYSNDPSFQERVDTVLDWFKNKGFQLATLYYPEPDGTGHRFGPNSTEIRQNVKEMDEKLGYLLEKVHQAGLEDDINVIVTSDHGMVDIDVVDRVVDISDYVNMRMVKDVPSLGAMGQILPVEGALDVIVANLTGVGHITVYRKENVPERYHYQNNVRIMPIVIVAEEGWMITTNKTELAPKRATLKGNHGYDNDLHSMRAMFLARGPNFKKDITVDPISNLDVYPLICKLLDIKPAPNNGSLDLLAAAIKESSVSLGFQVIPRTYMCFVFYVLASYRTYLI